MALQWSSPVRRNEAGKLLSQIPNELYSRILDYMEVPAMEKPRALTNIALVCRYFSYLTIPRIFDSFIFDGTCGNTFLKTEPTCQLSDRPLHKGLVPRYAAFCRAILANEGHARALATYVRSCRFMLWGQYDWEDGRGFVNCPTATSYLNLFFSALSSMENVTKLEFHWMVVTPELIRAIGGLKNLERLVLCKVSIDPSCTSDDCNQLSSLRLRHLTVIPTFHIHSSSSEDLCPLAQAFDVSQMKSLVTAVPSSVRVIESSSSPLPLRDLEIMVPSIDVPIRSDLFQGLPHLRRVSLCQGSVSNGAATLSLGEGCIPHLEDLECVPELLKTFVPGRPVSSVAVGSPWQDDGVKYSPEFLRPLSESIAPTIALTIASCWFSKSAVVYDYLQKVTSLKLLVWESDPRPVEERPELLEELARTLVRLPQLKKVQFALQDLEYSPRLDGKMDLQRQYLAMRELIRRPNLATVQLGRIIWTRSSDGDWDLEFEEGLQGCLINQAKTTDYKYSTILERDHRGYLERLLSPYGIEKPPLIEMTDSEESDYEDDEDDEEEFD